MQTFKIKSNYGFPKATRVAVIMVGLMLTT